MTKKTYKENIFIKMMIEESWLNWTNNLEEEKTVQIPILLARHYGNSAHKHHETFANTNSVHKQDQNVAHHEKIVILKPGLCENEALLQIISCSVLFPLHFIFDGLSCITQ